MTGVWRGIVGAADFGGTVGNGISIGTQAPTGGFGLPGSGMASAQGACTIGGDDGAPDMKNGQGGGTGKNASTDCMTSVEHTASLGTGRDLPVGTPPDSCPR